MTLQFSTNLSSVFRIKEDVEARIEFRCANLSNDGFGGKSSLFSWKFSPKQFRIHVPGISKPREGILGDLRLCEGLSEYREADL